MRSTTQFDVLTLFPSFFDSPLSQSILGRSLKRGLIRVNVHNLREFARDGRKTVDDKLYGGGAGMVLKVDVLVNAVESIGKDGDKPFVILLDPKGRKYNQPLVEKLAKKKKILIVCGRYEGVDERFAQGWADASMSVGDYVLSGGEPAALVIIDTIARLKPKALGSKASKEFESFSEIKLGSSEKGSKDRILDFPSYTKPESFRGKKVPQILLSGDHKKIENWRLKKAIEKTKKVRPDLLNHL